MELPPTSITSTTLSLPTTSGKRSRPSTAEEEEINVVGQEILSLMKMDQSELKLRFATLLLKDRSSSTPDKVREISCQIKSAEKMSLEELQDTVRGLLIKDCLIQPVSKKQKLEDLKKHEGPALRHRLFLQFMIGMMKRSKKKPIKRVVIIREPFRQKKSFTEPLYKTMPNGRGMGEAEEWLTGKEH